MSNQKAVAAAAPANTSVVVADILNDPSLAGAGFENARAESFAIPFLVLLQSGSPQCKRSDGAFIDGASEGMLLDSVSNEVIDVFKKPIRLVCVSFKEARVEWKLREAGGGFVAEHPVDYNPATHKDDKNRNIIDANGNQLVDTATFVIMRVTDEGVPVPMILALSSTQLGKSRKLMAVLRKPILVEGKLLAKPPMFLRVIEANTQAESNDKGSWFGWNFKEVGTTLGTPEIFHAAKGLYDSVSKGKVRAATESLTPASAPAADEAPAGNAAF
jgi:hypothetical protein